MSKTPEGQAEFRRPVSADSIGQRHQLHEIEAGDAERAALARRFDLVSLDALRATIRLRRVSRGLIEARGRFVAEVVQSCVVTLEPVPAPLSEEFKVLYTSEPVAPQHEIAVSPEAAILPKRSAAERSTSAKRSSSRWPPRSTPIRGHPAPGFRTMRRRAAAKAASTRSRFWAKVASDIDAAGERLAAQGFFG